MNKRTLNKIGAGLVLAGVGLYFADTFDLLPKETIGRWAKNVEVAAIVIGLLTWLA